MIRIDWHRFGACIRARAIAEAAHYSEVEKRLGISHARMINAAQGKPVGTEIFLTLCFWMDADPFAFKIEDAA
jgi:hypothetical protein